MATTENYLKLPKGRRLCYAEYGDPTGQPIFVFHGNPISMGQYLAEKIPNCEAKYIERAGHFWIFEHLDEMLEKLVSKKAVQNHSLEI